MKKSLRLKDYVQHILQAIERIEDYCEDETELSFLNNEMLQDAVVRNLEIIGEASNNILKKCPDFAAQHPDLPLKSAYEMRNAVAHGYFAVDWEMVWATTQENLPEFYAQLKQIELPE
ncbi:HepT-like ribonuclease domain-containing protein [Wielerella bovis]|uniref:HepT-like ribonuclease domain-containing protein n=1 Tax=Wielerella bovis TaxID=2917790 RepID=UPI00201921CB|nr:DUF86 domain-containing protein [Wielerella bovis]MCG7657417.1 DUF86 domain-containing protein [Wielerella bovis]MCG7659638.1 DUF86 domain-containing protein [Wielerella bovis]